MKENMIHERCAVYGATGLFNEELLSILLEMSLDKTKSFLQDIGGLQGLITCQLKNVKGLTKNKLNKLKAVVEMYKRLGAINHKEKPQIKSPDDVYQLVKNEMSLLEKEHFKALYLSSKHNVLEIDNVSIGTLNNSLVHPRELFKNAIRKNVAAIILVHNHPSGISTPSAEDIEITRHVIKAGDLIGIKILDHIVVGHQEYSSLKELGHI